MRGFITTLALLLPLIGCGPLSPSASLPNDAALGAADPTRAAIFSTAYAFNNPCGLATPAIAARAAANVEFLAVSLPHDARYGSSPTVNQQMAAARREMHAAGDNAAAERALAPAVFSNGGETLRRLAAMGPWPRTAEATAMAEREHLRIEQERINSQPGGDSSGRN